MKIVEQGGDRNLEKRTQLLKDSGGRCQRQSPSAGCEELLGFPRGHEGAKPPVSERVDNGPSTLTASTGTPRSFIGVGGVILRADEWVGEGADAHPIVLMLHGGGQTRHSWKSTGAELAAMGYHVIALDSRGHGESDWSTDADYGIQTMATDVMNALSALGRPAVLVGASMGGLTSLLVAQQAGASRVVALILVDVVPRYEKAGSKRVREFMLGGLSGFATLDEAADAVSEYLPHRPRPRSSAGLRRNLCQRPDGRWYWHWDPTFMQHPDDDPDGRLKQFEDATHAITVPMLLLHGGKSDVVGPEGVTRLLELAPHAQVMDLPTAAHTAAADDNEAFSRAVVTFVSSL